MIQHFKILYIEDEDELRQVVFETLNSLFEHVYTAKNGEDGLKIFQENIKNIDLIITDITMPNMNGIEMSQKIKNISPDLPIIITTAFNDNDFLHQAITIGIDAYILKPLHIKKLVKTILKVLKTKILQHELHTQKQENLNKLLTSAKFSAIGQLTAGLTHEINTPLTYIKGSLEMMYDELLTLPDSSKKVNILDHYKNITNGINRITTIVESMKETTSKSSEKVESVNIYETIITASTMAHNKAKHISQIFINGELFIIGMDKNKKTYNASIQKQRVEQVWIIIINNALDELIKIQTYEKRRLDITIEENEGFILLKFIDNAGGIKDEIFDKLFDPFKSTKNSSGMGIGLSIAKKIIEEQNGEIKAYNENNGAVFEIKLPNIKK